jgi:predicted Zn-dependent protease
MRTAPRRCLTLFFVLIAIVGQLAPFASSSSDGKRTNTNRDINAIGHRVIGYPTGLGNWYSLDKEKEMGAQFSAAFETSTPVLHDSLTQSYLDRVVQTINSNSDSQLPTTVRVIDTQDSYALTLAGGYQYISRGLLLQLQNEGELAAALARGIAHTALRSATGEVTRAGLMKVATMPPIFVGQGGLAGSTDPDRGVQLMLLSFERRDESWADYFGIQYLYKSGYAPECFIAFVQKAWPPLGEPTARAFSPFPPVAERVKALEKEIRDILPKESTAITNTEDFAAFREHLLSLTPPKPSPRMPTLVRSDSQQAN